MKIGVEAQYETQEGSFCQSCGMPMENEADQGTEADGTKSKKFCQFCYQGGKYTEPNITVDEMIEKVVGLMKLGGIPEKSVRDAAQSFIPSLERWRKLKGV